MNFRAESARPSIPAPKNYPKRILSVDNEAAILFTRHKLLEGAGYEVVSLADSQQALRILTAYSPCIDMVVLDYDMPGMNGSTLAREIKHCARQMPVIMVSGYHTPKNTADLDCFIRKGEGPALLLDTIGKLLASGPGDAIGTTRKPQSACRHTRTRKAG